MLLTRSSITRPAAFIIVAASAWALAQADPRAAVKSGYAPVNGLKMYYEIHGTGQPLILLHGGLCSTEIFDDIMPSLSRNRQVIAIDLQAHGRTADIDRPLGYEAMADDVGGLIQYLGLGKVDVMGYSTGGEVALRTAIQFPDAIRKLVIVSAAFSRDGWYPEIVAATTQLGPAASEALKQKPMYQTYVRVAPRPRDWPLLVGKLGNMFRKDYDWSKEVSAIKAPTLLVFGDAVLFAQRPDRIDSRGAESREQTRQQCGQRQHKYCGAERKWIGSGDST